MKKRLFINGEWLEAKQYTTLVSPFSGESIAEIPVANDEEVEAAIEAANGASKVMAMMPAHKRASILAKLADLFEQRKEEAASVIALEAAKPITTALAEVNRTILTYRFAAEEAKRIHGETLRLDAAPGGRQSCLCGARATRCHRCDHTI
ncbi:hypothetical protein GCM10025859_03870 [Alicyclobacillus fastidiosus]|nr:hypothetical protein GCM10025859_03870 [Alicyclobacillus fastidiosus]